MAKSPLENVIGYIHKVFKNQGACDRTDRDLLEQFLSTRDETVFNHLIERHGSMVYGVCRRLLGRHEEAEDAFQATFLVFIRRARSIRRKESIGNWLFGVAQRIAQRARVQRTRRQVRERAAAIHASQCSAAEPALGDMKGALDDALAGLPDKYRIPVVLCYLEGKSHAQAARDLGCPTTSLESRLRRALELLQRELKRRGVSLAGVALTAALRDLASAAPLPVFMASKTATSALVALGKTGGAGFSTGVVTMAEEAVRGMSWLKTKLLLSVLGFGLALGGVGWGAVGRLSDKSESAKLEIGHAPVMHKTPLIENDKVRVDALGDPLPEHALRRFGTGRFRHGNQIQGFAITKDGKMIATGGSGEIRLWDAATGRLVRSMLTDGSILTLGFSGDGRRLVSGAAVDFEKHAVGRLVIWDTATGKALQTVRYEPAWVRSAALSPDGMTAVMACDDGLLQTMDTESGAVRLRVTGNRPEPNAVAFSPDGKLFAARTDPKTLSILDSATGGKREVVARTDGAIRAVTFSPDGSKVAFAWDHGADKKDTVIVYDVANSQILWSVSRNPVHVIVSGIFGLAFSPDGQTLATSDCNATLEILDAHTGKSLRKVKDSSQTLHGVAYAADGKTVYTAGTNGLVRPRDALSLGVRFDPQVHTGGVVDLSESFDRQTLATDAGDGAIRLWDLATGKTRTVLKTSERSVLSVQFLRQPNRLVSGGSGGVVHWWDTSTGEELRRFIEPAKNWNARVALSPDGKLLAIGEVRGIRVWDLAAGKVAGHLKGHTGYIVSLSFSPDGVYLATAAHSFGDERG